MKKLLAMLALSSLILSCKKESGPGHPKQVLLSEVRRDSLMSLRFSYNSDDLLTKIESFNHDVTDNTLTSYINFQYNDKGEIKQFTAFSMPDHIAYTKVVLTYDSASRIASAGFYDLQGISPNTIKFQATYTYNAKDQVIKVVRKDKDGNFDLQNNFLYYEDGHLKEVQGLKKSGDQLWMYSKSSYSLPDGYFPHGLEQIRIILGTDFVGSMYSSNISRVEYSQAGVIMTHTNEQMSNREYNGDGTLSKQKITSIYVKPEKDDKVSILSYKYIQQ